MTRGAVSAERPWRRTREVILADTPAAGAEWAATVPGGETWIIECVHAELTTGVGGGQRLPALRIEVGGARVAEMSCAAGQGPGTNHHYTWANVGAGYSVGPWDTSPLPRMTLEAGAVIGSATDGIVAGDQWAEVHLYVTRTLVQGGAVELASLPDLLVDVLASPVP